MVVSINVTGKRQAIAVLGKGLINVKNGIRQGMAEVGLLMQTQVKRSIAGREAEPTSVDTGRLLNSVEFTANPQNVSIFTPVPYGKFIEHGTTKFTGRHHFQNSLNRNKKKIKEILQREVSASVS